MKIKKILALMIIIAGIFAISTVVFAQQPGRNSKHTLSSQDIAAKEKMDPIQRLEKVKEKIQNEVSEGKITKQEGLEKTDKIDRTIKEIQAFNKLSPTEKKEKLIKTFTQKITERVKENKLTQQEADKALAEFKAVIDKWDGTGYPPFPGKGMMKGHKHHEK